MRPEHAVVPPLGPTLVTAAAGEKTGILERTATLGLVVVLGSLISLAIIVVVTTRTAAGAVDRSSRLSDAYDQARYEASQEESLNRKYRLEPAPDILAARWAAHEALAAALQRVSAQGTPDDRQLVAELLPEHEQYRDATARMFAAIDAGEASRALRIDAVEVDPVFDAMQQRIDLAANGHRLALQGQLRSLRRTEDWILAATLAISIIGLALVGACWRVLTGYHRRLGDALTHVTEQSRRDPLTGALNHGAITEALTGLLGGGSGRLASIVIVDVDALKALNDTFGHLMGDAVLQLVVRAMKADGAQVGRSGGDEFIAVLDGADRARAEAYCRRLKGALGSADLRDPDTGTAVPACVSTGIAVFPREAGRIEDLIGLADSAMYADKLRYASRGLRAARGARTGRDRAARIVGDLVPLLVQGDTLDSKLGLVARHVATAAGYAGVHFDVYENAASFRERNTTVGAGTVSDAPPEMVAEWVAEERSVVNHPIRALIERTRRPVILEDLSTDARMTENERRLLVGAGLNSGITIPIVWQDEVIGSLSVGAKEKAAFGLADAELLVEVARHAAAIIWTERLVAHLQHATEQLASARDETMLLLAASVETHDGATGRHLARVREMTEALALELGQEAEAAQRLGVAAVLHDVGKVRVPDGILRGSGALTEEEWIVMKQHTVWGAEFLSSRPGFELAAAIARAHHERWDGSGYPAGIVGEAIPEAAAIVAVADAFDAMTNDRPYRPGRTVPAAVREIVGCTGRQFSPRVVAALVRLYRRRALGDVFSEAEHAQLAA